MTKQKTISIRLTEPELWEVVNLVGQGFDPSDEENSVACKALEKLKRAHDKVSRR